MSECPRFKVATCSGYTIRLPVKPPWSRQPPGLTASVLDTANIHREVACYRSETPLGQGKRLGRQGALQAAQEHADRLNAEYA